MAEGGLDLNLHDPNPTHLLLYHSSSHSYSFKFFHQNFNPEDSILGIPVHFLVQGPSQHPCEIKIKVYINISFINPRIQYIKEWNS